jgi:nitroimidazol reductase NimA-like FMN-containing flavoprotein (pyridoxamine 5'-phosphate oxidase superfamily)
MDDTSVRHQIYQLFDQQRFAVIATEMNKQPYAHLVGFAVTSNLKHIVFATKRDTQKYRNITRNTHVAAFVDNRQNNPLDFSDAITVTALGTAKEISDFDNKKEYESLFMKKHPELSLFLADPACALIKIEVMVYQLVKKFEEVHLLTISTKDH